MTASIVICKRFSDFTTEIEHWHDFMISTQYISEHIKERGYRIFHEIVGSAYFTGSKSVRNVELSVHLDDEPTIDNRRDK